MEIALYEIVQVRNFFWSIFPMFGLNTEIYRVNLGTHFEYGKMQTRKNSALGQFSSEGEYYYELG